MDELVKYIQDKIANITKQSVKETDRLILEYMKKKNLTVDDLQGNVAVQNIPYGIEGEGFPIVRYWYKGELILSMKQRIYQTSALEVKAEMVIEKGDW